MIIRITAVVIRRDVIGVEPNRPGIVRYGLIKIAFMMIRITTADIRIDKIGA
jgi:hypothetical protein